MTTTITLKAPQLELWITSTEDDGVSIHPERLNEFCKLAVRFAQTVSAGSYENFRITGLNAQVDDDADHTLLAIVSLAESGGPAPRDHKAWQEWRRQQKEQLDRDMDDAGVIARIEGTWEDEADSTFSVLQDYLEKHNVYGLV